MRQLLSFKEYYETKKKLLESIENIPKVKHLYSLKKYCKVPFLEDDKKSYISFKPKDQIEILWEYTSLENPIPLSVTIINEEDEKNYTFSWNGDKVRTWVVWNCSEIK